MTFVDIAPFQLFTLAFVSTLLFYSGLVGYLTYVHRGVRATYRHLRSQAVPLGVIGGAVTAIGLWGSMTWPITEIQNGTNVLAAYNILFFDPYLMLGVVLVSFAACVMLRLQTQYAGVLAAFTGALSIYYGLDAYRLGLTNDPTVMLFLYAAMGGTAILTFPVTILIDRMVVDPALDPETPGESSTPLTLPWKVSFGAFILFLLFAAGSAVLALAIGGGALAPHLSSPP